jgi:hypothetical protein
MKKIALLTKVISDISGPIDESAEFDYTSTGRANNSEKNNEENIKKQT